MTDDKASSSVLDDVFVVIIVLIVVPLVKLIDVCVSIFDAWYDIGLELKQHYETKKAMRDYEYGE